MFRNLRRLHIRGDEEGEDEDEELEGSFEHYRERDDYEDDDGESMDDGRDAYTQEW